MVHSFRLSILAVGLTGAGFVAFSGGDPIPGSEGVQVGTPARTGALPFIGGTATPTSGFQDWPLREPGDGVEIRPFLLGMCRWEPAAQLGGGSMLISLEEEIRSRISLLREWETSSIMWYSTRVMFKGFLGAPQEVSEYTYCYGATLRARFFLKRRGLPGKSSTADYLAREVNPDYPTLTGQYASILPPLSAYHRRGWKIEELPRIDDKLGVGMHPFSKAIGTLDRLLHGAIQVDAVDSEMLVKASSFATPFLVATTAAGNSWCHIRSSLPQLGLELEALLCRAGPFADSYCA